MAYAAYEQFAALYGEALDEAQFDRLLWEAEQVMDQATTGVDGVAKLRAAMPEEERAAQAVCRCACALTELLARLERAAESISLGREHVENADGTLQPRMVAARSSGSESVTYAAGSGSAAVDAAVSDPAVRRQLLDDTVRRYLAGVPDGNGVNLLYMGPYPVGGEA